MNRISLAACMASLGMEEAAEAVLLGVLSSHPGHPMAHYHLGRVLQAQHRPSEARAAYEQEIACSENNVPARLALGDLLLQQGDLAGYRDQMERVVAISPDRAKFYFLLARAVLGDTSDLARAETLVNEGLALADTDRLRDHGHRLRTDIEARQLAQARMREALG